MSTEPVVGFVMPAKGIPCTWDLKDSNRINCKCRTCVLACLQMQNIIAMNKQLDEATPDLLSRHLLGGKTTIEEVETPFVRARGGGFRIHTPVTKAVLLTEYTKYVVKACNGNKSQAARVLGIDRRSVYRRLGDYKAGRRAAGD